MTDFTNPVLNQNTAASARAGDITINRFEFDFAGPNKPPTIVAGDRILIGTIPAGTRLVPHLSRLRVPITGGVGTELNYTVGTDADADALVAATVGTSAIDVHSANFAATADAIGDQGQNIGVYITFTATRATPATGKVLFEPAIRAWQRSLDE